MAAGGQGNGPPSTAAPTGEPATSQPPGLLTLFPSTLPLASHSPCAHVCACLCMCCVCAFVGYMCHLGMYMCASMSAHVCVCVDMCTQGCRVRRRPVLRPPPTSPRTAEPSGLPVLLSSCQLWMRKRRLLSPCPPFSSSLSAPGLVSRVWFPRTNPS